MNKVYFLPLALAAAFSAVANETYTNIVTGVSSVSSEGVPTAIGGTWTTTGCDLVRTASGAVEFDTGDSEMQLNITAAPADTNTIVRIEVEATLADAVELSPVNTAQTGFAVCTNSYNAWNGTAWVALDEVPSGVDDTKVTNLTVEVSYQYPVRKARFTVGDTVLLPRGSEDAWIMLYNNTSNSIAGLGFSGAGTLAKADASVMLGVAELDGVKYGTLTEAVAKAEAGDEVAVLRPTEENVTLDKAVAIADGGNVQGTITVDGGASVDVDVLPTKAEFTDQALAGKSGEYTIPVKVSGGTVNVVLPPDMSNKEIVGNVVRDGTTVKVRIQTAADVITNAAPGGKALAANETKLREFLDANVKAAYEAADVTSGTIAAAISTNGVNNIPLYQSYALGIDPDVSVKPVAVPNDAAADGITLTIPAIDTTKYSGDYAIKYQVGAGEAQTTPGEIKVPLTTGSHAVKIIFE